MRGCEATSRILLQQSQNEVVDRRSDVCTRIGQRGGLVEYHGAGNRDVVVADKWFAPSEHFVQHRAETPQIRARIDALSAELFRRYVRHCATPRTRIAYAIITRLREAKVEDLDGVIGEHHHVSGLQVTVNDACRVRAPKPLGNLSSEVERFAHTH